MEKMYETFIACSAFFMDLFLSSLRCHISSAFLVSTLTTENSIRAANTNARHVVLHTSMAMT